MEIMDQVRNFVRGLRNPKPRHTYRPNEQQKNEITEAIRKQRFRGDLAGRFEYKDD